MPGSRSAPPPGATPPSGPRVALEALLAGSAGDTLRRARWLDAVDQLLRPHLPPMLAAHARLANVRGDKLVFVVDAPVWHARLRLATPALVDAARSVGLDVADVAVRTTSEPLRPLPRPEKPRTPMSAAAQSELEAALALLRSDAPDPG
ncbi:DUF721 domain-containing protein [Thermomonas brevis]